MYCPGFRIPRSKKHNKNIITCNVQTPLFYIHPPPRFKGHHIYIYICVCVCVCVYIYDAFYEALHVTMHSALKATIYGTHVTKVIGENGAGGYGSGPLGGLGKRW